MTKKDSILQEEILSQKEAKDFATNFEPQSGDVYVKINAIEFKGSIHEDIHSVEFGTKYKDIIEKRGHPIAISIDMKTDTVTLIYPPDE